MLSTDEQARLGALLLDSVEAEEDAREVEAAWLGEVTKRLDEHEKGLAQAIPRGSSSQKLEIG